MGEPQQPPRPPFGLPPFPADRRPAARDAAPACRQAQGNPSAPPLGFEPPPADVSHVRRKWLDVPYAGPLAAQKLDLYLPDEGAGPFAVILFIHGGAFAMMRQARSSRCFRV